MELTLKLVNSFKEAHSLKLEFRQKKGHQKYLEDIPSLQIQNRAALLMSDFDHSYPDKSDELYKS